MGLLRLFTRRKKDALTWASTPPSVSLDSAGRRHRDDIPYLFPKDDQEVGRLDYQHYILRQVLQGNTFAPVHSILKRGGNVLDVGCGTGKWGHEIATSYPRSAVIGFDIEHLSHRASPPRNYQFHQGNVLNGLPFVSRQFQYVHQRLMVGALPLDKWPVVIREFKRVTVPGGWVELVEMGTGFQHTGPATEQFFAWWNLISAKRGINASKMEHIGYWLGQAGFQHIRTETKHIPVGGWGGRIGTLFAHNVLSLWRTIQPHAQEIGVAPHVFEAVIESLSAEWDLNHTTCDVYVACGLV